MEKFSNLMLRKKRIVSAEKEKEKEEAALYLELLVFVS